MIGDVRFDTTLACARGASAASGANSCLTLRVGRSGRAKRRRTKKKDSDYEWGGDDVAEASDGAAHGNAEAGDERSVIVICIVAAGHGCYAQRARARSKITKYANLLLVYRVQ